MNSKNFNWVLSAVAVVLTLAVLTGGQMVWQRFTVVQPMDKLLQSIDGVTKSSWEEGKKDDVVQIYITLGNVSDFPKTYGTIHEGAKRILGSRPFKINITDSRTAELERFYYHSHYLLQEAVFTGNFSSMDEKIRKLSTEARISSQVYVEAKVIYVKFTKDAAEMYAVVTR
mgnify:CR=1 FL=1